mmetsp:Transcript_68611/g.183102  ORF Transcript_68611/g.183102 Transcript_68611/m.183102 type:complete len:241 (+) Transcript_68611:147-869(+)
MRKPGWVRMDLASRLRGSMRRFEPRGLLPVRRRRSPARCLERHLPGMSVLNRRRRDAMLRRRGLSTARDRLVIYCDEFGRGRGSRGCAWLRGQLGGHSVPAVRIARRWRCSGGGEILVLRGRNGRGKDIRGGERMQFYGLRFGQGWRRHPHRLRGGNHHPVQFNVCLLLLERNGRRGGAPKRRELPWRGPGIPGQPGRLRRGALSSELSIPAARPRQLLVQPSRWQGRWSHLRGEQQCCP